MVLVLVLYGIGAVLISVLYTRKKVKTEDIAKWTTDTGLDYFNQIDNFWNVVRQMGQFGGEGCVCVCKRLPGWFGLLFLSTSDLWYLRQIVLPPPRVDLP